MDQHPGSGTELWIALFYRFLCPLSKRLLDVIYEDAVASPRARDFAGGCLSDDMTCACLADLIRSCLDLLYGVIEVDQK
jgi:hypothetical protein